MFKKEQPIICQKQILWPGIEMGRCELQSQLRIFCRSHAKNITKKKNRFLLSKKRKLDYLERSTKRE